VSVHAGFRDPEERGDLLRREAAGDRPQNLALAIGERGHRLNAPLDDTPG
jgi:hypothetical protein